MICQNTRNIYMYLNKINTKHVFGGGKNIYWYNKHIVYIKLPLMDFTIKIWKQSECFNSFWKKITEGHYNKCYEHEDYCKTIIESSFNDRPLTI